MRMMPKRQTRKGRLYVAVYKMARAVQEHSLHWVLMIGPDRHDALNERTIKHYDILHSSFDLNGRRIVRVEHARLQDLVCRVLVGHLRDVERLLTAVCNPSLADNTRTTSVRASADDECAASMLFVQQAVHRLGREDARSLSMVAGKHRLDWPTIESRTLRYALLQYNQYGLVGSDSDDAPVATYDLLAEEDTTLLFTGRRRAHTSRLGSFSDSSTSSFRNAVLGWTSKLRSIAT